MRNTTRKNSFKKVLLGHIENNKKEYIIVTIVFLLGIVLGVFFVNQISETESEDVTSYLNNFIYSLKGDSQIDKGQLLKNSIINNIQLAIVLWFVGSTVIGIPLVYGIVAFRGFSLGYTIAIAIAILGNVKGLFFCLSSVLFQNIIFIPCVLGLAVSGIKLYKSIIKDKRKENIKMEIIRHTIFCLFMTIILLFSSIFEVYLSTNLLTLVVKYI